ncbi:MAG: hypothetical protein IJF49_08455 [Clostridia bacterium]|nr:hypothetical protein [Clostridia bacterium]
MPTRYKAADKRTGVAVRRASAEFQNLRLRFRPDHLNVVLLKKYTKAMYARLEKADREMMIAIAMATYDDLDREGAAEVVDGVLSAYDPVTGYVYHREVIRKRDRLVESMAAAQDRAAMQEAISRAQRLWVAQMKQFADEVVDAAMIKSYRDAGIGRVRWVTVPDAKRCTRCAELDGEEFSIDDIPSKPHRHCRCYVVPVE